MVGIVIVSHSRRLAEGVAELAREMGGPDVRIETAGGLEVPEDAIGTDAVIVARAIELAWSDDGVLVLMDLGSAVLSAEMAMDLLPEDRRGKVLLCEAPLVEGAVAAAVTAKMGEALDRVAEEARGGLAAKAAHLGAPVPGEGAGTVGMEMPEPGAAPARTIRLKVVNPHGLHARPAARLVQTASGFDADVRVGNPAAGRVPVSARSLNAVATLGVRQGDEIEVCASGREALQALEAIETLAAQSFGDEEGEKEEEALIAAAGQPPAGIGSTESGVLRGLPAAPGLAIGKARRFHPPAIEVEDRPAADPDAEWRKLGHALAVVAEEIAAIRASAAGRVGDYQAAIFDAHLLFLQDEALVEPARRAILEEGKSAAWAWKEATERMAETWAALDDEYLRARVDDLSAVSRQVLAHLLGIQDARPRLEGAGILVAASLTPADAASLDRDLALGIATAFGGPTSHSAVLARSLGIPAVVGLGEAVLAVEEGTTVLLDGEAGALRIDPAPELVAELLARQAARSEAEGVARAAALEPAVTRDGTTIEVAANVGSPDDVPPAVDAGADGVGLFRTEFLFMGRDTMPNEDEQEAAYRQAAERLDGRPMIVRTLDVGADKPLPYLAQPPEENPFLGERGVRLGLARPDLLATQLRAILRVAADHPVRVMFPMVATIEEVRAAKSAIEEARASLATGGQNAPAAIEVGIMVEVPAAALAADRLAAEVDFFSIGTNDLTQYTLAADRGNERVAGLADALHPAVLRLTRLVTQAAEREGFLVGVCGELAAEPLAAPVLIGLGVRELSMSAPAIASVKQAVRSIDVAKARQLAEAAMSLESAAAVRELLRS